jgi:hypothetical protein
MEIGFLNVDLVVDSEENLQPIADELAENIFVMFNGEWQNNLNRLSVCLKESHEKTANEIVSDFCSLLENLSASSKWIWDKCHSKKFDVGFESGNIVGLETEIQAKTVERIAKLGASILVTIYPNDE